tara:strand:- start:250 stop:525 length:276 start_codon:yes stop_codon:yes gene_type:complete
MGNYCMKLYEKIQPTEKCPYCKKNKIVGDKETTFVITSQGCRICRLKNKYIFKPVSITKVSNDNLGIKMSYKRVFEDNNNINNNKVTGRYY